MPNCMLQLYIDQSLLSYQHIIDDLFWCSKRSRKTITFRFLNLLQTSSAAIVAASVTVFAASANAEAQVDYVVGTVQYQTHRRSSVLKPSVTLLLLLLRD